MSQHTFSNDSYVVDRPATLGLPAGSRRPRKQMSRPKSRSQSPQSKHEKELKQAVERGAKIKLFDSLASVTHSCLQGKLIGADKYTITVEMQEDWERDAGLAPNRRTFYKHAIGGYELGE